MDFHPASECDGGQSLCPLPRSGPFAEVLHPALGTGCSWCVSRGGVGQRDVTGGCQVGTGPMVLPPTPRPARLSHRPAWRVGLALQHFSPSALWVLDPHTLSPRLEEPTERCCLRHPHVLTRRSPASPEGVWCGVWGAQFRPLVTVPWLEYVCM